MRAMRERREERIGCGCDESGSGGKKEEEDDEGGGPGRNKGHL